MVKLQTMLIGILFSFSFCNPKSEEKKNPVVLNNPNMTPSQIAAYYKAFFSKEPYLFTKKSINVLYLSKDEVSILLNLMLKTDQSFRDRLHHYPLEKRSDFDQMQRMMVRYDSLNREILSQIIQLYNWPDSTFGDSASRSAWYITMHSNYAYKANYVHLVRRAAEDKKIPPLDYAIIYDRILRSEGKKQLYGTHGYFSKETNEIILLPYVDKVDSNRALLAIPPIKKGQCDILIGR